MEWQPIETAPKDGTWVLVWGPPAEDSDDDGPAAVVRWNGYFWEMDATDDRGEFSPPFCETHWMPLPEPPQ